VLSRFDDYPIHQTPDPIAMPASSDPDVYERYWFNGYSSDASMYFGIGVATYPHLGLSDASISIVLDGHQHSFHASARSSEEPSDMTVGPLHLAILEPMRSCSITLAENDTGWSGELTFEGRTANIHEPRHQWMNGTRRVMDTTRFAQLGRWSGWLEFEGQRTEIDPGQVLGTKDRSWGLRPVGGGDTRAAPAAPGNDVGLFFLWAPLHFDDLGAHFQLFEDVHGRVVHNVGALMPAYESIEDLPGVEDPDTRHTRDLNHMLSFGTENRMVQGATLSMTTIDDGTTHEIALEKVLTFRMKGIGYSHPEWGHGNWIDELALGSESWALDEIDETEWENQHVQHLVKARMGDREGIGVLEQIIFGPYAPYGFTGFLDPLPGA